MLRQLLFAAAVVPAATLSGAVAAPIFQSVQVRRSSDGFEQSLGSLWADDERAILVFLRHFG